MESYNKQLRDRKELEKKLNLYERERKSTVNFINMEKSDIQGGLLDVQSKTKNLTDTVNSISSKLKEERMTTQTELKELEKVKNHPMTYRRGNRAAIQADLAKREKRLVDKVEMINAKLELLTGQKQLPEVNKALNINLISKKKGFGALLGNIRKNKEREPLPVMKSAKKKPNFHSARNVCELIQEFQKLPKIYPRKPKMKKPKMSEVLMRQYEDRKKERELAMNYGTRKRIKRAQFHCDSLADVYIPKTGPSQDIAANTMTASLSTQGSKRGSTMQLFTVNTTRRAMTH